jgi:phosphohistidine phosphatase
MTANKLYFVQHGLAASKTDNPERPLSEDGIKQTQNIAKQLLTSNMSISSIFHSGKLRAQQTADIIASILNIKTVTATDYLSPNDDITLIKQHLNADNALYVGHLPHLEKLISCLVTGKESPVVIKLQNSAIVCLEKNNSLYHILWYLTPQLTND